MRRAAAGAGAAGCMRLLLLWALALCAARAAASTVYATSVTQCAFKQEWSRDSAALFALAHTWSRSHDVQKWTFSEQGDNCSHVDYESRIHLPDFFSLYWKAHEMKMGISKHVCVHGQSMRETLVISGIPFVDDVTIKVYASAHAETATVSLSAEYAVVVPWYLAIIDAPVQEHVRKSILEYLDVLQGDICAAPAG